MTFREQWGELGTGVKLLIGLGLLVVLVPLLVIVAGIVASFVLGMGGGEAATAPVASWSFDYSGSSEELTITHESGDSIDAAAIDVEVESRTVDWAGNGTVEQGDSTTVEAGPDDRVRVVWHGDDGSETLGEWSGN